MLALHGGHPVRDVPLPYGRQSVDAADIAAVVAVLQSDWLTTGPLVPQFEHAVAEAVGAAEAVAVSSGTAALHAAMYATGIGPGDEVIVPALTFVATANAVVYQGGTPVFVDVDPDRLLIDPTRVAERLTERTKAIVAVDYAGHPADYDALRDLATRHGLTLIADACHALGATYRDRPAGSLADLSVFSFHPVKHVTTGEGGVIATTRADLAAQMRTFRNHGIDTDHRQRAERGTVHYEMTDLGYNYRLTDVQCALGLSQLRKLASSLHRRREIAHRYDEAFASSPEVRPFRPSGDVRHAYHLYVIEIELAALSVGRDTILAAVRAEGIGANVHYAPVHLHPYYRKRFGYGTGECPAAERASQRIVSRPMFPAMTDRDVDDVVTAVRKVIGHYAAAPR